MNRLDIDRCIGLYPRRSILYVRETPTTALYSIYSRTSLNNPMSALSTTSSGRPVATQTTQIIAQAAAPAPSPNWWMYSTGGLSLILILLGITSYRQSRKLGELLAQEKLRGKQLKYHVKKRGETIVKMEKNPDLINSRDFNLDYLRMRMAEEVFHFEIVNQIKSKVRDKITVNSASPPSRVARSTRSSMCPTRRKPTKPIGCCSASGFKW
jgi:hypothetical protein